MAEKTHVVKQEEGITELPVQVRGGEPVALKDPQYWLDTNSNKVYLHAGGVKYVIANGMKSVALGAGLTVDAKQGGSFYKEISANTTITINNLDEEGNVTEVIFNNTGGSNVTIGFSGITIANQSDLVTTVRAGRIAVYRLLRAGGNIYALLPVRTESVFA